MSVYVDREKRGSGVGGRLYRAMEFALKNMNVCNLYAAVAFTDRPDEYLTDASVQFHKHFGYKEIGRFCKCGYKFGRWYSLVWLQKTVNEQTKNPPPFLSVDKIRSTIENYFLTINDSKR